MRSFLPLVPVLATPAAVLVAIVVPAAAVVPIVAAPVAVLPGTAVLADAEVAADPVVGLLVLYETAVD
ncbi:MAG: hypothetical protein NVSMB42_01510 [Herpetosiphon sp.]